MSTHALQAYIRDLCAKRSSIASEISRLKEEFDGLDRRKRNEAEYRRAEIARAEAALLATTEAINDADRVGTILEDFLRLQSEIEALRKKRSALCASARIHDDLLQSKVNVGFYAGHGVPVRLGYDLPASLPPETGGLHRPQRITP